MTHRWKLCEQPCLKIEVEHHFFASRHSRVDRNGNLPLCTRGGPWLYLHMCVNSSFRRGDLKGKVVARHFRQLQFNTFLSARRQMSTVNRDGQACARNKNLARNTATRRSNIVRYAVIGL